jgi:hypothetical protein
MNFCNNFAVDVFTTGGTFIGNWPSISEAARALGIKGLSNISKCLRGEVSSSNGYVWKYNPQRVQILEGEHWIPILGYEDRYAISDKGRVAALQQYGRETFIILKPAKKAHGYLGIGLRKTSTGTKKNFFIHRLVATAFLPNPENKEQVDHIDTNKSNNCVDNLRWVTSIENNYNPITLQRHKTKCRELALTGIGNKAAMEVKRIAVKHTVNEKEIYYNSYLEAAKATGHSDSTIRKWCMNNKNGWSKNN